MYLFLLAYSGTAFAGEPQHTKATLKSVTVYTSGALMQHTAQVSLLQGNNEIIIDDISNAIDINSVQIKTPATVVILGQEFSNNFLSAPEKTARVKMLEDSVQALADYIDKLDVDIANTTEMLDVLKSNKEIKGSQSGMSVAELTKLMEYYETKQSELNNKLFTLNEKRKKADVLKDKLALQIKEEQSKNATTAGRLTLQINATIPGKAEFTITYIAANAYWKPFYDIRVDKINEPAKLIYRAKIVQTTGIDWKQVKLSLSTSLPSKFGNAPEINTWFVGFVNPYSDKIQIRGARSLSPASQLAGMVPGLQLNDVVITGYSASKENESAGNTSAYTPPKPVYIVNGSFISEQEYKQINPSAIKKIDKLNASEAEALFGAQASGGATVAELKDGLDDYVSLNNNTLNINFDIETPYDVPTNGKEQVALLQTVDMDAVYEHYCIPKLNKDAFLVAEIPGWEKYNLLAGNAMIIVEGTYVGKTFIDPSSVKDTLNISLGQDARVVIERKQLKDFSAVKFLGSNKLQKFEYEITAKNNKAETVTLVLRDQYPLSTTNDIEAELLDSGGAEINKDSGILTWKITLNPGEIKKLNFSYSIKYPKDKTVNMY